MCVFVHLVYYMRKRTLFNIDYGPHPHTHIHTLSPQVLDLFRNTAVLKCTTLKNMLATASAIVGDLFSAGQKRVQLFETVLEILSGNFCTEM